MSTETTTEAPEETATAEHEWQPRLVGILCYWCSYAGADLAGSSRLSYPPNIRIVRVPCSGRADPLFVLRAFARGADGVIVAGCHPGDCHYAEGNYYARRRMSLLKRLVEYVGIPKERFKALWVSASEGKEFAEVINEMVEDIRPLGPFRPELAERFAAMPELEDVGGESCPEHTPSADEPVGGVTDPDQESEDSSRGQ